MEEATKIISRQFQYISCYCLSIMNSLECLTLPKFQYISCYCLSFPVQALHLRFVISIHLMLLFIKPAACRRVTKRTFQYISCYCLSFSHLFPVFPGFLFQYISCYCLSCEVISVLYFVGISIHLMLLFILSKTGLPTGLLHFNTSHVTVYLQRKVCAFIFFDHFNTSHVTVYRLYLHHLQKRYMYFNTSHVTVYRKM